MTRLPKVVAACLNSREGVRLADARIHQRSTDARVVDDVYDPIADRAFAAAAGAGAWCNGERLKTSRVAAVSSALVAVSLPAHVRRDAPDLADFVEAVQICQAVRRSGSAALNFAHVA